jgi:sialate O-acetylesterase
MNSLCLADTLLRCKQKSRALVGVAILSATPAIIRADVTMPTVFGDHMVLQQDAKLPVWGWADPGETVKVCLGSENLTAITAADGTWRVEFPPRARSEGDAPQVLTVTGHNALTYQDVLIGDVWIASGQSNMAFGILNDERATEAVAGADQPKIRLFRVAKDTALDPRRGDALQGKWTVCTPENLKAGERGFSAVAYYFGREIVRVTGHPVGLVGTYWGGTPAEAWTSLSGLQKEPQLAAYVEARQKFADTYKETSIAYPKLKADYDAANRAWYSGAGKEYYRETDAWQAASLKAAAAGKPAPAKPRMAVPKPSPPVPPDGGQTAPATLFNAMIAPLIPYAIKGVIWYQGEANGGSQKSSEYGLLFRRLISDWREKWGQGDFPFLFVQIANFGTPAKTPSEGSYPLVREGQMQALSLPATGMAVTIDIGNPWNVHPKDKLDVGLRLALAARHVAYGESLVFSGPLYESNIVEGNKIRVTFSHVGGGLMMGVPPSTPDGMPPAPAKELTGFGIAGADRKWVWAKAAIEGNTVVLSSDKIQEPVAVRYGWANSPSCNLYNREGLPASPFRTDNFVEGPLGNHAK